MSSDLTFDLSPTQFDFVMSDAHIAMIVGPMGEGKTYGAIAGCIVHAQRCGRDIRGALIRDTFRNIQTSTIPDIKEILGPWAHFSDGDKKLLIKSTPSVQLDLFGIDDPASISKLQGPQYALIWLEEPAPIYEKANAGLPRQVFNMALARAARQVGTVPRVQISQNPADEDHWTAYLADEPEDYMTTEDGTVIRKEVFRIQRGENKYLSSIARAANMAAFKDDPAKWQRYVEGETATVHLGKRVTPGYSPKIHYSSKILPVFPGPGIQMWDGWHSPTCMLCQWRTMDRSGAQQLVIHDVLVGEEIGTRELIQEQVKPLLSSPKWRDKITEWRAIGDPSMRTKDQSSKNTSAAKEIEEEFGCRFEMGPAHWKNRKEPLNLAFKRMLDDGNPVVLLSRSAMRLHKALKGGWHYKTDNNGNIIGDKPVQTNSHAHPGNAFSYGVAILLPYNARQEFAKRAETERKKRAMSYAGLKKVKPPVMPGLHALR